MKRYFHAPGWAVSMMAVGLAGMFELIDKASMTTLLAVLPAVWLATATGRGCHPFSRRA
jgi:hypothetical protein